ncbi:MAG: SagB/ThcOx family dehydrogenase [Halorhabdus sp.]
MTYQTNRLSQFVWDTDNSDNFTPDSFVGKTYTDAKRAFEIDSPELLRILEFSLGGAEYEDLVSFASEEYHLDSSEAKGLVDSLIEREFILPVEHSNFDSAANEWLDKQWRRALYFHLGTRDLDYADRSEKGNVSESKRQVLSEYDESPPAVYPSKVGATVDLPEPEALPEESVNTVMSRRRTRRNYSGDPLSLEDISTLLYHTFNPVREVRDRVAKAAADDPIQTRQSHHLLFEVYLAVMRCENDAVDGGLYHYSIDDHTLHTIDQAFFDDGSHADDVVSESIVGQQFINGAGLACYFSACFERYQWRYRHSRAMRTMFQEIPSHAHRMILVATALGLGNFLTPAQKDELIDDLFGLDGFSESIAYFVGVGK